ncbi:transposase [Streptomyces sp. SAI-144]|uniref:transposase n=1 Tax=Streptomyces sp. SAI-144 TaxID=2940544 RepID=UPI002475785E|nr:transposase [Streptomyces sp. SAI-144]
MQEIYNAEDRSHAEKAIEAFAKTYGAKFPKAVAKITDDRDELLAFYDFPAEHWIHLRTTNPIESTFSTVKLRTKVTRGAGSPGRSLGDGVQARRIRPGPLARHHRSPPRRPGPRGRRVRKRRPGRARRGRRCLILCGLAGTGQLLGQEWGCHDRGQLDCAVSR